MKIIGRISILILVLLATFLPFGNFQTVKAQSTDHWCGGTSETLNYGFSFSNGQVAHWTIENGANFVSPATIDQVDVILDKLNSDNISLSNHLSV